MKVFIVHISGIGGQIGAFSSKEEAQKEAIKFLITPYSYACYPGDNPKLWANTRSRIHYLDEITDNINNSLLSEEDRIIIERFEKAAKKEDYSSAIEIWNEAIEIIYNCDFAAVEKEPYSMTISIEERELNAPLNLVHGHY